MSKKLGLFGKKKKLAGLEKGDSGISFPSNFKHETHVTYDIVTKKFKVRRLCRSLRRSLARAAIQLFF